MTMSEEKQNGKTLLCVDGNSILNRAFYGIRPLTTRTGIPTNAVYGFVNILSRQLQTLHPDYLVCAFDLKEPTFRHKAYDAYKAGRHETPPELLAQFGYAKDCARAMGFHVLELAGYEADDILGTCAAMANQRGVHAYLLTGDRDALQLISDDTTVLLATNRENIPFTPEKFYEVYGISPAQFVDVKALMGDASDHIPGVRGIGEKTALKLIAQYGDLEHLYQDLEQKDIAKGVKEKLKSGEEDAGFSKFLATIVRDAPLGQTLEQLQTPGPDRENLRRLFVELEFSKFLQQFDPDGSGATEQSDAAQALTLPQRTVLFSDLPAAGMLSYVGDGADGLLCDGETVFRVEKITAEQINALLPRLTVYDSKALYHVLADQGVQPEAVQSAAFDVMLGAYCLQPGEKYDLEKLFLQYLHADLTNPAPPQQAAGLYRLTEVIAQRLEQTETQRLYQTVELPLSKVLFQMECSGFCIDLAGLKQFGDMLGEQCEAYSARIYLAAGRTFNINSPKQLGEVLFDELQLPCPTKKRSTGAEVLEKLRPYHPIIGDILEYRQVMKLKSTYADGLLKVADETGRVHTTFQQAVTATGRLSSTEPNLQNIPIRTELGREMRRFFVTRGPEYVLVDADYSQIELRLLAAISGDENMIAAFRQKTDIHTLTASEVFGVAPEQVTPQLRSRAKAVNFGIVYGIGDYSLAVDIGVSKKEAGAYIASYLATYPGVAAYLKEVVAQARKDGYVTTVFGRRRYIPELSSQKKMEQAFGERVAMNSPIQGSAADIIKLAMIHIFEKLKQSGLDARLILQVHDELLVECRRDQAQQVRALLKEEMEHTVSLPVELTVDVQSGDNWFEGH